MQRLNRKEDTREKITLDEVVVETLRLLPRKVVVPSFKEFKMFSPDYTIGKVARKKPTVSKTGKNYAGLRNTTTGSKETP